MTQRRPLWERKNLRRSKVFFLKRYGCSGISGHEKAADAGLLLLLRVGMPVVHTPERSTTRRTWSRRMMVGTNEAQSAVMREEEYDTKGIKVGLAFIDKAGSDVLSPGGTSEIRCLRTAAFMGKSRIERDWHLDGSIHRHVRVHRAGRAFRRGERHGQHDAVGSSEQMCAVTGNDWDRCSGRIGSQKNPPPKVGLPVNVLPTGLLRKAPPTPHIKFPHVQERLPKKHATTIGLCIAGGTREHTASNAQR